METIIVICLLIIIVLLVQDKIVVKKRSERTAKQEKVNPFLPDIMGQPKLINSQCLPNTANESQMVEQEINPDNLDIEYDENESVGIQIPQEELDEVFSNMPDLSEEEEEWNRYGISGGNNSLAQGVTYDELTTVTELLQKEYLDHPQKEKTIALVQKLQGTELFSLMESAVEGATKKIAELLDSTLTAETEAGSSTLRKINFEDFDIGKFI